MLGSDAGQLHFRRRENDGPRRRSQQRFGFGRKLDQAARNIDVLRHQRERFFLAEFPLAQSVQRLRISRVAGQVIAAEPFHGDDLALLAR